MSDEKYIEETYKKLSDLTEQLTSLTTMSKVVANTALLHDIHNQLAALNHLSEKYKGLLSEQHSSSGSLPGASSPTSVASSHTPVAVVSPTLHVKTSTALKQAETTLANVTGEVRKSLNVWNKAFGLNKMARFLLFVFMFFFIFKIIDHILEFFDVNKDIGYIYFVWFTIIFFLFVVLPLQRSRLQPTPKQHGS